MKICFASHNEHKLHEIQTLAPEGFDVIGLTELGQSEEIPETGSTLEENSALKARFVFEKFNIPVFADDSGLEVSALNNEPGVYSARYAGPQRNADDNMNLLLQKLQGKTNRQACFKTVITFIDASGDEIQFNGQVDGQILKEKRGSGGFGYDPIFVPEDFDRTFAEMTDSEKNKISHRRRAFDKLLDHLRSSLFS